MMVLQNDAYMEVASYVVARAVCTCPLSIPLLLLILS
jgi:hypothetical protein